MTDFSTILQTPEVRAVVQEGFLERAFHDSLFPRMIFRGDVVAAPWPSEAGDTYIATAPGIMEPDGEPLRPGVDPDVSSYPLEQWEAQLHRYSKSIDTNMPTSVQAIVDLLMRNAHQLGMQAAQTLNRLVRDRMFNVAESGWTVADGAGVATTSLRVKRLNGFTKARNPAVSGASRVRFSDVSSSNPLTISIAGTARVVTGYTPDTAGDEIGPGVLTISVAHTWSDRDYVKSVDASDSFNVGGGNKVDDLSITDLPTFQDIRTAITRLRRNNVPMYPDMNYHCHISPDTEASVFADTEVQRMLTGRPDNYMYTDFVLGKALNTVFICNTEAPEPRTVYPYDGITFSPKDAFAPELTNDGLTTGMSVQRMLFTGFGLIYEYYQDPSLYITEAGITGKMGDCQVSNNGIEITAERVKMIMRAPLNRLQDVVSTSWLFVGDWPCRTDAAAPGTNARYKRALVCRSGTST